MNRFLTRGFLSLALITTMTSVFPVGLAAQELSSTKGGLAGVITDATGAVIPTAKITIVGQTDTRVAATDGAGHFLVDGLTPGRYTVTVEAPGFNSVKAANLEVVINRVSSVSLSLAVGVATQTVEVEATTTEIDTGSTAIGSNLNTTFYDQVPVARNVGSLFYTAPGVTNSGGAGVSNPSIGGSSGLENQYVADGVNIGDAGYGGLGVYSPNYGSLGTGINLTFIEEVQVKTGAFEPKYGTADGGVVQLVTKSGGTQYHGAISAFFAPDQFSGTNRYADDYGRVNVRGRVASEPQYDAAAEIGGYVPGAYLHDKLFFYGAFNPALNQFLWSAPPVAGALVGTQTNNITDKSWAAKVTYKFTDNTTIDASAFGDPTTTNSGYGFVNADTAPYYPKANQTNKTAFSHWDYGSRSETVHLTSAPTTSWEFNISASAKVSHFTEVGTEDAFQIFDYTKLQQPAAFNAQGLGYIQNPQSHTYSVGVDTQKTVSFFKQQHTLSVGWNYLRNIYDLTKAYSGGTFIFPDVNADGVSTADQSGNPTLPGATTNASFNLELADPSCPVSLCPYFSGPNGRGQVYLQQDRGLFSNPVTFSSMSYHSIYGNDDWAIDRRITLNIGLRWDEEQLNGIAQQYVFTDNWSPRLGINIDPFGDHKSKVFFNFGRYTQSLPEDAAIRSLGQELDIYGANWSPESDGNGNAVVGPFGSVVPILDAAHLISGDTAAGAEGSTISASGAAYTEIIAPKTKLNFEEEYVGGLEKQFGGFVVSARYTDRRLLRIIEDQSGSSPEGALTYVPQNFEIGNPNSKSDYFTNEVEVPYTFNAAAPNDGAPADCPQNYNVKYGNQPFLNSAGQVAGPGGVCGFNGPLAGAPIPDGKPDGAPNARRHYQAIEIEANKNFSHNFLLRVNYRWAKLFGNYEGLFRNDNDQSDPSISSLFDFTQGVLGMLGDQYVSGFLNTDRRQVGNLYGSYVVPGGPLKRFQAGLGLRGESGIPITNLGAHPVYDNDGEIPLGGRGALGTQASNYQLDAHVAYPVSFGEKYKLKLAFDAFNVTDSRSLTFSDQESALSYGDPNVDFLKPKAFQRAIYGRASVKFEF